MPDIGGDEPEVNYEDFVANLEENGLEDVESILTNANLRLEQGNLYRMIMGHDIFQGVDADPQAIANVQAEIRGFVKERMEIMLGMKTETSKVETLEIDFPFNEMEVKALKALAFAATKGASEHSDAYVPEVRRTSQELPTVSSAPRKAGLNTIGGSTKRPSKPAQQQAPQRTSKPLPTRAAAPVKKTKLDLDIDQICREEGISRELLEENHVLLNKPLNQLTDSEVMARNKRVRNAHATTRHAMPQPGYDQELSLASSHAQSIVGGNAHMQKVLDIVKNMPIKPQ
jgi:hypothetical protein